MSPRQKTSKPSTKYSILWFVLVALASVLRLAPIGSGLPYSDYVDEGFILHPAIRIASSKSDTSAFTYPPLTSYLTAAAIKGYAPFYRIFHHHKLRKDFPTDHDFHTELGEHYDLITPPDVIWLGRFVVACLSIATVILTGALAKLLGGSRAGYLAMLFSALCPALVNRGSIVIIDTTATFFVVATLYFCQRLRVFAASNSPAMRRGAVLAGIASGLASGAKVHRRRGFRGGHQHNSDAFDSKKIQSHFDLHRRRGPVRRHFLRSRRRGSSSWENRRAIAFRGRVLPDNPLRTWLLERGALGMGDRCSLNDYGSRWDRLDVLESFDPERSR